MFLNNDMAALQRTTLSLISFFFFFLSSGLVVIRVVKEVHWERTQTHTRTHTHTLIGEWDRLRQRYLGRWDLSYALFWSCLSKNTSYGGIKPYPIRFIFSGSKKNKGSPLLSRPLHKLSAITTTTPWKKSSKERKIKPIFIWLFWTSLCVRLCEGVCARVRLCWSAANESICDNYADKREPMEAKLA